MPALTAVLLVALVHRGRRVEWAEKLRAVDANENAFIEWPEFLQLGKENPELLDIMRQLNWSSIGVGDLGGNPGVPADLA